jgi:hypothetical protein
MPVVEPRHPVERVVLGDAGEGLVAEGRRRRPLGPVDHRRIVIAHQLTADVEQVAFEVEALVGDEAARVIVLVDLAAEVAGLVGILALAVCEPLDDLAPSSVDVQVLFERPAQRIVGSVVEPLLHDEPAVVAGALVGVPGIEGLAGGIADRPALAGIHAVLIKEISGDVVAGRVSAGGIVGRVGDRRMDILHHPVAAGVADPQRLALGIELGG